MMEKIFVQIASYRDPELVKTIKDCLDKAKYPDRLSFGICWQHSKEDDFDNIEHLKSDKKFKIKDFDYRESQGVCWARRETQKMWDGEKYTLQIDSHIRFLPNWDEYLIEYFSKCDSEKPILTSYPNPYYIDQHNDYSVVPSYMKVFKIDEHSGVISFIAGIVDDNWMALKKPFSGKFLAAGFMFTYGDICEKCPYDPNLYFNGEEMSFCARTFTHGYDIYHPHKNLLWHLYQKQDHELSPGEVRSRVTHWNDHSDENSEKDESIIPWGVRDKRSKLRIKQLFGIGIKQKDLGKYGFGKERTLEEFEKYCGLDIKNKKLVEPFEFKVKFV